MVKLAYTLNMEGKGKMRKRTLEEVLAIIRDKKAYLQIPTTKILRDHMPSRQGYHYFSSFSFTLHFVIYPLIQNIPLLPLKHDGK
jgi:hypothetical protein